jgi:3-phenylpropionate/trans-cinnamate dioxygenase ferredoxin component
VSLQHNQHDPEQEQGRWVKVCGVDDIEAEDVMPFVVAGRNLAVYRSPASEYFATDQFCTHEQVSLADGLVIGCIIECPKHNGRFDYTTGEAKRAPTTTNLRTYPVRVDAYGVFVDLG